METVIRKNDYPWPQAFEVKYSTWVFWLAIHVSDVLVGQDKESVMRVERQKGVVLN